MSSVQSLSLCFLFAASLAGCSGGGNSSTNADSTPAPATTTMPTPSTTTEPAPEPFTHAQFIKRLDHLCGKFNRKADRRFGAEEDAAAAANDYGRLADVYQRSIRFDRPFYVAVRKLGARVPEEDATGLSRYLSLSHERDTYFRRYIRALREHDDAELTRLSGLIDQVRNQRTRVTAKMGLRVCGS
jgi:hypothetical protein